MIPPLCPLCLAAPTTDTIVTLCACGHTEERPVLEREKGEGEIAEALAYVVGLTGVGR